MSLTQSITLSSGTPRRHNIVVAAQAPGIPKKSHQAPPQPRQPSLISVMPFDILSWIFELAIHDSLHVPSANLRAFTHVCRHWRMVAMDYPVLWSLSLNLAIDSEEWVEEALLRSLHTLLHIKVACLADAPLRSKVVRNVEKALRHPDRVKSFSLTAPRRLLHSMCAPLIGAQMSELQSLSLVQDYIAFSDTAVNLPFLYDDLRAPRLRHLELKGCQFPWPTSGLERLVSLQIENILPAEELSLSQVLASLAGMPLLEDLRLVTDYLLPWDVSFTGFSPFPSPVNPSPTVKEVFLPRLSKLDIASNFTDCMALFRSLRFPSSASISIAFDSLYTVDPEIADALRDITARFSDSSLHTLHLSGTATNQLILVATVVPSECYPRGHPCRTLSLQFGVKARRDNARVLLNYLIRAIAQCVPLLRVHDLIMYMDPFMEIISDDSWELLFRQFQSVRSCHIFCDSAQWLFRMLNAELVHEMCSSSQSETRRQPKRLLSTMQSLRLMDTRFEMESLVQFLDARKHAGRFLAEIDVTCSWFTEEMAERIRPLVGELRV